MPTFELHRIDVTVDVALFTVKNERLHVLLTRRGKEPFKGALALPGGYVHAQEDETSYAAAARVLRAKAGLVAPYLAQLGAHANATRDPRGWSVSIAHYALVPFTLLEAASGGEDEVIACDVESIVPDVFKNEKLRPKRLAFDHTAIVREAVQRLRGNSQYSTLPVYLAGDAFTLTELQRAFEVVLNGELEPSNFRRWLTSLDILQEVSGDMRKGPGRAAQVYQLKEGVNLQEVEASLQARATRQPSNKSARMPGQAPAVQPGKKPAKPRAQEGAKQARKKTV